MGNIKNTIKDFLNVNLLDHRNHDSKNLSVDNVNLVNCDFYDDKHLYLHNHVSYEESIIHGSMKNIKTNINTVNLIYDKVIFKNCEFINESWYDKISFKNCEFIDCDFYGRMRWCYFDLCYFNNTNILFDYIRGTIIKKTCSFKQSIIKIKHIDENNWVLGKRYPKYYHPNEYGINIIKL